MDFFKANLYTYRVFDKVKCKYTSSYSNELSINECWSDKFDIFTGRELFVHVGLKPFCKYYSNPQKATETIVNFLNEKLRPVSFMSQSFTPTFRKSGVYSIEHSKAEIGLFAEQFRVMSQFRTSDPIHNVSYTTQRKDKFDNIDYHDTFGEAGFYSSLYDRDAVIVNLLTGRFVSTYLHFLEEKYKVPYKRKNVIYSGVVYSASGIYSVEQKNHAEFYPVEFNRKKIYNLLLSKGAIVEKSIQGRVVLSMVSVKLMDEIIGNILTKNPYFLVSF